MYYYRTLLRAAVLVSYGTNVLCLTLQVAAKVAMYYEQCCNKLHLDAVIHGTIVLVVIIAKHLHKGPGL